MQSASFVDALVDEIQLLLPPTLPQNIHFSHSLAYLHYILLYLVKYVMAMQMLIETITRHSKEWILKYLVEENCRMRRICMTMSTKIVTKKHHDSVDEHDDKK